VSLVLSVLFLFLSPRQEHAFSVSLCLISLFLVAAGRWTVLVAMLCIPHMSMHILIMNKTRHARFEVNNSVL